MAAESQMEPSTIGLMTPITKLHLHTDLDFVPPLLGNSIFDPLEFDPIHGPQIGTTFGVRIRLESKFRSVIVLSERGNTKFGSG